MTDEEQEVTGDAQLAPAELPGATEIATFDLDDLPTGVFRRPALQLAEAAAPTPVVTGSTERIAVADRAVDADARRWSAAASFAGPVPPLLDDSPLDRSCELDLELGVVIDPGA